MIKLTGNEDIDKVFRGLPGILQDRVFQQANAAAAKPLLEKEKLTAPEGPTGTLIDSLGIVKASASSYGSRGVGAITVGPKRSKGGFHGHLVEFGTVRRSTKGKHPANRGIMPAHPFAEPAWEATQDQVREGVAAQLSVKVLQFMRRTIKKG